MSGCSNTHDRRRKFLDHIVHEAKLFAVMFLYLYILFGLFVMNERIILHQRGIEFASQGFALIKALVLAKVMLVAENVDLRRWVRRRPLIYLILYQSALLTALFICFHVIERVVLGLAKGESLGASFSSLGGGGLDKIWCVAVILFVSLIPFFAFRNIRRKLGANRLDAMLFGVDEI